jgi:hypothetical protein
VHLAEVAVLFRDVVEARGNRAERFAELPAELARAGRLHAPAAGTRQLDYWWQWSVKPVRAGLKPKVLCAHRMLSTSGLSPFNLSTADSCVKGTDRPSCPTDDQAK